MFSSKASAAHHDATPFLPAMTKRQAYYSRSSYYTRPYSTSSYWCPSYVEAYPSSRYSSYTDYLLSNRLTTSPYELRSRIRHVLPYGQNDYNIRAMEGYLSSSDPYWGYGSNFDDRLYYMMRHHPSQVARLVRKLTGHW